jgi:succinyl-CoA synthetase beta subunit
MNIHEHQAKEILKSYGAPVSNGVVIYSSSEIKSKISQLNSKEYVLKAQIHAGGRGKAGGVKLIKKLDELQEEAKKMLGKILITHQTGFQGKEVKRLYVEEASDIEKEFYLSCIVDRQSSKIAFISSIAGGMDIEKVAAENPEKIITTKVDIAQEVDKKSVKNIVNLKKEKY